MEQISMFDLLMPTFKINKPLRLIEFFAGYGSQALALKYLGAKFEHWKICEWALNSIIAYASLHRNELAFYDKDFSQPLSKNEIAEYLFQKGVSIDYNQPATLDQLKRVAESKLRLCYNSIQCTHNLVDISRVKGNNLEIEDIDKYTYLLTYSFPCQDLSLAGKGKGMEKGSGTRSGLLWEVERILSECENKPQILLMENVTQVHGVGNEEHFKQWLLRLEEMGYQSYWNDMSAVCYGIPQTRNRTFMVSIHGEYNYKFPKPTKLKLRLKDMLESNVDEKFYLSQKMIDCFMYDGTGKYPRRERFLKNIGRENIEVGNSVTTLAGSRPTDNFVIEDMPNQRLRETLNENDVEDGDFIDTYNRSVQKGKAGTTNYLSTEFP